ncbi:tetratricopeptide repeat protein [Streptosporangium sp. NPDC048865]|uniref:ATP-binding protein n=1 Tax=Streptosporangium sp. NPDC048865 TaxID=3155766 RepID=UPI003420AC39
MHNQISGGIFFAAVIQGRDIIVQLPPQVTPALSGLPAGAPAFTGRTDSLRDLLAALEPGSSIAAAEAALAVVVTAVGGMGGVGKTELAIQAARTALARGWFPGGALFVDLFGYDPDRRLDPGRALDGLLRALGISGEHIPFETQDRARLYASVLSAYAQAERPILVVVDNASDPEQVRPLLPRDSGCRAIVTSRHTLGMLNARLLDLNVLTPQEAIALLGRAVDLARPGDRRVIEHEADAAEVARLCGYLPLALRIVAALLTEDPARPLTEMASDLTSAGSRLTELQYGDAAVRATFELSYRHLAPEQARLFRLMAVNPGRDISTAAVAALIEQDLPHVRRLLAALARAHLIEHSTMYGRWRMHDLVRLFADQQGQAIAESDGRLRAFTMLLSYYLDTATAAADHLHHPAGHAGISDDFDTSEEALAWLDAEFPNLVTVVEVAAAEGDVVHVGRVCALAMALAPYLDRRRSFAEWITLAGHAVRAARALGDRQSEGVALSQLGTALGHMWRFSEAVSAHDDAIAILIAVGDQHAEATALGNLGATLHLMGHPGEAIDVYANVAAIFHDLGDRPSEGTALDNLGNALREVRRFGEAIAAHESALSIFRETADRSREAMGLTGLGVALAMAGRVGEAVTAHEEAVAIYREIGDRHGEGVAMTNLGSALHEVRRFGEAIAAHESAAAIFREIADRNNEGTALDNLGRALHGYRRYADSIVAHEAAVAIYREIGYRRGEGRALANLGSVLHKARRFDEAVAAHHEAVALLHEAGDIYDEAMALTNLGAILYQMRRYDDALAACGDAYATFRELEDSDGVAEALMTILTIRVRRLLMWTVIVAGAGLATGWLLNWQAGVATAVATAAVAMFRRRIRPPSRSADAPRPRDIAEADD